MIASGGIDDPVHILHTTFMEFLFRQSWVISRSNTARNEYALSRPQTNRMMAQRCLSVLLKELKFNMFDVDVDVEVPKSNAIQERLSQNVSAALPYAASAWISHTIAELHNQDILATIRHFFREKLLNRVELGGARKILSRS